MPQGTGLEAMLCLIPSQPLKGTIASSRVNFIKTIEILMISWRNLSAGIAKENVSFDLAESLLAKHCPKTGRMEQPLVIVHICRNSFHNLAFRNVAFQLNR